MSEGERLIQFLTDAAAYFKGRPHGGKDKAYWANIFNAENCTKAADYMASLTAELAAAHAKLKEQAMAYLALDQQATEALERAVEAGAERDEARRVAAAQREALEWYGEQSRLCRLITSEGDPGRWALAADGGKRALAALKTGAPSHE